MILFCATTNAGKLREFRLQATDAVQIQPTPGLRTITPPEETGSTFEDNAILKAGYYGQYVDGLLFAEDSGLAVDALDGAPGVYSARFAGPGANDEQNNALLLEQLEGKANRTARYVCAIALMRGAVLLGTFRGVVEGHILTEARGAGGFGYDPLFYYPPFGCTFAEVSAQRKAEVSHRGQAFSKMLQFVAGQLP